VKKKNKNSILKTVSCKAIDKFCKLTGEKPNNKFEIVFYNIRKTI